MKNNKKSVVIRIILFAAAAVLLIISISGKVEGNWPLSGSLICIVVGNLINLKNFKIMQDKYKKDHPEETQK